MASIRNTTDTQNDIIASIYENTVEAISGIALQNRLTDMAVSYINRVTDKVYLNLQEFSASRGYDVGECTVRTGLLYQCSTAHTGAWNAANFTLLFAGSYLPLAGGTMTGNILFSGGVGLDTTATGGTDTLNIGITNADAIVLGRTAGTLSVPGAATFAKDITVQTMTVGRGNASVVSNTAMGVGSLQSVVTGGLNTCYGYGTGANITTGQDNIAVGYNALSLTTVGSYLIGIGDTALFSNKAGSKAVAIGYGAMQFANDTAVAFDNTNTAVGFQSLRGNSTAANNTGIANTAVGFQSLYSNTSGNSLSAFGYTALYSNTTGIGNTAIGYAAMYLNVSGSYSTAIGETALYKNTGGTSVAVGYTSLYNSVDGVANVAVGNGTLLANISGNFNTAFGYEAGSTNLGSSNVFIGFRAGQNETGSNKLYIANSNTASPLIYGDFSTSAITVNGTLTTTGEATIHTLTVGLGAGAVASNTVVGYQSMGSNTSGSSNIAVGYQSLFSNTTGALNSVVGREAFYSNVSGSTSIVIGYRAMYSAVAMSRNVAIGYGSMLNANSSASATNSYNTAVGYNSMAGSGTPANNTGTLNTGFGPNTLANYTSGTQNTAVGYNALLAVSSGSQNTAVGFGAGFSGLTTGSRNVFLGYYAGANETGSDKFFVDNQDRTTEAGARTNSLLYGIFNASPASQSLTVNGVLIATQGFTLTGTLTTTAIDTATATTMSIGATNATTISVGRSGQVVNFVGTATATTQSPSDNSTSLATTAFVKSIAGLGTGQMVLTAAGGWSSATNGASAISQVETSVSKVNYFVADFLTAVQSYFEWDFALPSDYNGGTITAVFYWTANSTSTNSVVWGIAGRAFANSDAIDGAFGTAIEVTQANTSTANQIHISSATAAITLAGAPAASQYCQIRVYRLGSGADTLAATARLLAVKISYTKV